MPVQGYAFRAITNDATGMDSKSNVTVQLDYGLAPDGSRRTKSWFRNGIEYTVESVSAAVISEIGVNLSETVRKVLNWQKFEFRSDAKPFSKNRKVFHSIPGRFTVYVVVRVESKRADGAGPLVSEYNVSPIQYWWILRDVRLDDKPLRPADLTPI